MCLDLKITKITECHYIHIYIHTTSMFQKILSYDLQDEVNVKDAES